MICVVKVCRRSLLVLGMFEGVPETVMVSVGFCERPHITTYRMLGHQILRISLLRTHSRRKIANPCKYNKFIIIMSRKNNLSNFLLVIKSKQKTNIGCHKSKVRSFKNQAKVNRKWPVRHRRTRWHDHFKELVGKRLLSKLHSFILIVHYSDKNFCFLLQKYTIFDPPSNVERVKTQEYYADNL